MPTSVPIPPTPDLITFMRDGTVIESQRPYLPDTPWGPLLRTAAHGAWERTGAHQFAVTVMLIYQGAPDHPTTPGQILAIEKARMTLNLDPHGNHLLGPTARRDPRCGRQPHLLGRGHLRGDPNRRRAPPMRRFDSALVTMLVSGLVLTAAAWVGAGWDEDHDRHAPPVVFDTDMDSDDAVALALLAQQHLDGRIDLRAVTITNNGGGLPGKGYLHARCLLDAVPPRLAGSCRGSGRRPDL